MFFLFPIIVFQILHVCDVLHGWAGAAACTPDFDDVIDRDSSLSYYLQSISSMLASTFFLLLLYLPLFLWLNWFYCKKKVCSRSLYWAISRKKTSRGLRTYFFETPLQFLIFFFYHWKFQTKQSSTPGNSTKLCQIPSLENPGRSPRPLPCWKFHIIFSWSSLEVPLRF